MAERRESVRLELNDGGFSTQMLKNAAATGLLERALKSLDGTSVTIHERISDSAVQLDRMSASANKADGSINQLTGRLRLFADAAAVLGPALVPLGGVGIAGIAGLASQMGFAAVAGGVLIGSLQGVGDALGAMNAAQLDPTAKNLEKAEEALKRLSPAARDFAEAAFDLKPALTAIRDMGAEALMPGLTESLDNLERLGPKVAGIFQTIAGTSGDLAADITGSFASDRWADFFAFIEREAPDAITELATTVGDLTHGMSELWEAFTPLNDGFSSWLMGVADGFDEWATGLSATEGFAEFVNYIQTTGPQLADTLGAIANAVIQIVQATAPLATPVLAGLEAAANAIGAIADSDLGTPIFAGVAALALLNRSLAVTAALSKTSLSSGMFAGIGTASKGIKGQAGSIKSDVAAMSDSLVAFGSNADKAGEAAGRMKQRLATGAGLAGVAVAATGAADAIGLTNTMSLALMGSLGGPPGIAIGAAAGLLMDLRSAGMGATEAIQGLDAAVQSGDMDALTQQIAAAKAELVDLTTLEASPGDVFDRFTFQIADTFGGPSMDDAKRKIEASEKALEDLAWAEKLAGIEAKGAALEFLTATGANVDLGKWSRKSTEAIKTQADALIKSQEAAQETAESFVTLGDSLSDGKKSLGDWIKEMADSAQALRNFTANSRTAAKKGLDEGLIASLQDAGEEGALRMRQLANASDKEIGRANNAWRNGKRAMKEYVDFKVPPKQVTADTSRAMQSFREVDTYLSNLNGRTATTYVNTVRTITGPQGAAVFGQQADGGSVPKSGRGYADRFPYLLADGEEVITNDPRRNSPADSYRPVLKAINADMPRHIIKGMLAEGGTAGGKDWTRNGMQAVAIGGDVASKDGIRQLIKQLGGLENALKRHEKASERQTKAIDTQTEAVNAEVAKRDEIVGQMAALGQATTAGFQTGLFDTEDVAGDSNVWASGARGPSTTGGWLENLSADLSGLSRRADLQTQLAAAGLDGAAFENALSQGSNEDLASLLAGGAGAVQQFETMFNQRESMLSAVGAQAGNLQYGAELASQQASLDAQTSILTELKGLEGEIKAELKLLNREQRQREAAREVREERNADRTGTAAGAAMRGETVKGHRDRQNRGGKN